MGSFANLLTCRRGHSAVAAYDALVPAKIRLDDILGALFIERRRPSGVPAQGNADDQNQQGGQEDAGHLPLAKPLGSDHGMIGL